jgi:hypothetical protein
VSPVAADDTLQTKRRKKMSHYSLLLITETKPDEKMIEQALAPFYECEDNENSKWDWYQIGGRFSGKLDPDYDPEKDPHNIETCNLCQGTGMRTDALGRAERAKDPTYSCNACSGAGKRLKWPTQWATDIGNQLQVKDLKEKADLNSFAYLRDGQWVERGEMGWWAVVANEKDESKWAEEQKALIASLNKTDWLTVIDCHI